MKRRSIARPGKGIVATTVIASEEHRDIEKKIRDYIAAWAKDDCKNNQPVATYREFQDEMKSEGLKADRDGYDYYIACYNGACKDVKGSTEVKASEWIDREALEENEEFDVLGTEFDDFWEKYLSGPEGRVNEELQIYPEPSIQGGAGDVFIFDESGKDRWDSYDKKVDWWDWCDKEMDLALASDSAEEYEAKYRAWMKSVCGI